MTKQNFQKWFRDNGDKTHRLNYDNLSENSVVFDLGGYYGTWSEEIVKKYNPFIYIFEPIDSLYREIKKKFESNPKIKVFNFGLSDINSTKHISLENDGSSFHKISNNTLLCNVRNVVEFLNEQNINKIDLIKINVEGDEFLILEKLLVEKKIQIFENIQVQFHDFYPNAIQLRDNLQSKLSLTHKLTYNYDFVWENWQKK